MLFFNFVEIYGILHVLTNGGLFNICRYRVRKFNIKYFYSFIFYIIMYFYMVYVTLYFIIFVWFLRKFSSGVDPISLLICMVWRTTHWCRKWMNAAYLAWLIGLTRWLMIRDSCLIHKRYTMTDVDLYLRKWWNFEW